MSHNLPPQDWSFSNYTFATSDLPLHEALTGYDSLFPSPSAATPEIAGSALSQMLPDAAIVDGAIDVFFKSLHPMCPILDENVFRSCYGNPTHKTQPSFLKLLLCIVALVETSERLQRHYAASEGEGEQRRMHPGQQLLAASAHVQVPVSSEDIDLTSVQTSMLLFISWDMLGERDAAWIRLQEAIILSQILGLESRESYLSDLANAESRLRVFWMLIIAERATVVHQHYPQRLRQPLRLPDHSFEETKSITSQLSRPDAMSDFPLSHIAVFSLVDSRFLHCFHGQCTNGRAPCTTLKANDIQQLQSSLSGQSREAMDKNHRPGIQHANLVITIAWFRE